MQILHSKTALNRSPRILSSENANSALKLEILCSENSNIALKNSNDALNWLFRILCSENGYSAFKKWKFCMLKNEKSELEKWKISPMPWKVCFSTIFCAKSVNSAQFHAAILKSKFRAKFCYCRILERLSNLTAVSCRIGWPYLSVCDKTTGGWGVGGCWGGGTLQHSV